MGKRKQRPPQKASEDKRKCLSWNMLDDAANGDNELIDDKIEVIDLTEHPKSYLINDPIEVIDLTEPSNSTGMVNELRKNKQLPTSKTDGSPCYRREDLLDIFNLHIESCLFTFPILPSLKLKQDDWTCTLAEFSLNFSPSPFFVPLPSNSLLGIPQLTLHVSNEGEKNVLCYYIPDPALVSVKNSKKSGKSKNDISGDVKFWLVDTDLPVHVLEAFKCRNILVVIDSFDPSSMCIRLKVIGTEAVISQLSHPSEAIRSTKHVNQSLKVLMAHFYGIAAPDYDGLAFTKKHDIDALYRIIKEEHMRDYGHILPGVQHPDLLPRLRPYQQQAITWMLLKEKLNESNKDELHFLYTKMVTLDGKTLYFNKYAGVCVQNHPVMMSLPPGGILGEEMGLGKTVEVLACMLHNPRENVPLPEPLPVTQDIEVVETKKKKKRKKAKRRNDSYSNSDSDDTVIYEESSSEKLSRKSENQSEEVAENENQSNNGDAAADPVVTNNSKNIFVERPEVHKEEFECLCGATEPSMRRGRKKKHAVQCTVCRLWQHAECVSYDLQDPLRGEFKCPHCHVASEPLPSGATLIISPFSIAHQWVEEILKHVKTEALNVLMYRGVHKQGFVQPQMLAKQDIVITTYETLRKEIDYVDLPHSNSSEGRKLRHAKRFMAVPSPITAVQWWRICLDEAQMLECTTTKTAEMALRLSGINKWCVTGTPIQKSIDDLYGLVLFLGIDPYWVQMWWHKLVFQPYCYGITEPMFNILTSILWRTVKKDVLDQIDIPDQTDQTHWLTFSPVEEHFYRRQYRDCVRLSMERLSKWTDSNVRLSSLDRHTVSQLLYPLLRLRQACCHPQAVRGEFLPINKTTMTMEELLESLTKKAKLEAEESHRALVAAINGEAGLHIINEQIIEAVEKYRDVLRSVEEHKDTLKTDTLQQLHAIHNLHEILKSKPVGVAPTLRDDQLEKQIGELKDKYMAKAVGYVKSTEESLIPAQVDVKQLQDEFVDCSEWWIEVLQWASDRDMDDTIVNKIRDDLLDNRNPQINTLVRSCRSTSGLEYAVHTQLTGLEKSYKEVLSAMKSLEGVPSQDTINQTVECCLRPVDKLSKSCPFCKSEELFEVYEAKLFSFVEKGIESHMDHVGYQVNTRRQGTWADSEVEKALKSILSYAKHHRVQEELIEQGTMHVKLFEAMKKEFKKLRTHWAGIKEYVASFDELDMSITRLRLRLPHEPIPETPHMNVLETTELSQHKLKLASDRIIAQGELRKKLGQFLYLMNLAKNQTNSKDGSNPEPCPICQQELGKEWSVMQCGHCYCIECIRILVERASFGRRNFSVRCAVCRQNTHHGEISYVMTSRELQPDDITVKGSHSTKVEAVVRCLLEIQKEDPTAKSLVFSTWTDVLSVIASGLEDNGITYRALYSSGKFQENLSSFRQDEDVTTLLLPVHSGANGLNLIEATHVLLVEPILNPAQELQAIGRVHRIGQTKATHVHRFIIRNTIEQKMIVLLQSMNKHNVFEKSEESSLTIGDLSALFAQQIEDNDREGVHSPGEDEETTQGLQDRLSPSRGETSQQTDIPDQSDNIDTGHSSESSGEVNMSHHPQTESDLAQQERLTQGEPSQQMDISNHSDDNALAYESSPGIIVHGQSQAEVQLRPERKDPGQTPKQTEHSNFSGVIDKATGCEMPSTLHLPCLPQSEASLHQPELIDESETLDEGEGSRMSDNVAMDIGCESFPCTTVNGQSQVALNLEETKRLSEGQTVDQSVTVTQNNDTKHSNEMTIPTKPATETSDTASDEYQEKTASGDHLMLLDRSSLQNTKSCTMYSDNTVLPHSNGMPTVNSSPEPLPGPSYL